MPSTAKVGGGTFRDKALLAILLRIATRSKALVVPGMRQTSSRMDRPHGEAWDVLLVASDESSKVFNSYSAN